MSKFILSATFYLMSFALLAQEAVEEAIPERKGWTNDTKWTIAGIFAVVIVILVLRTFRNKPTV